ncbi:hypothetical protein HUT16_01600 [Kitasatospora sp. NA04385]|uniref:hypothetical protein n=1 Tax=Kitasatospora sp. NA04385 TaxID=2742135 RepID=UPI001591EFAA|nr:hypothetical protein [Kitasatospora sp. NA04385]QKW17926.1 hypothetical protein HUT16_01600 [Kitasatospora sp. NA04385]
MPAHRARPHRRLDLTALHDLHRRHYLRYAELLLHAADAHRAIDDAFDALAETWPQILSTSSPAACAWQAVRDHVRALADPTRLRPTAHLEPHQQDALLLHTVLALPIDVIADLTGAEAATVHVHLRTLTDRAARPAPG